MTRFLFLFLFLGNLTLLIGQAVYDAANKHTFTTDHGNIEVGPFNTSWAHIYSDRPKFIFNRPIWIQGGVLSSYSSADLILRTNNVTRMTILNTNGNVGIGYSNPQSPLHLVSDNDAIQTFQTSDDTWLYTNWKSSNGTRKAYMGLDNSLSEFRIAVQNGADQIILDGGNVGIGTFNPIAILDVNGNVRITAPGGSWITGKNGNGGITSATQLTSSYYHPLLRQQTSSGHYVNIGGLGDRFGFFGYDKDRSSNGYDHSMIMELNTGYIGIGTIYPDSKLTVKGDIHAQEVKVDLNGAVAPDYVFDKDYDLKSLKEVQEYINQNGHLPNIPSAKEMQEKGVLLKEMNLKLLEKIEELTLYVIELKKENEGQSNMILKLLKNIDR